MNKKSIILQQPVPPVEPTPPAKESGLPPVSYHARAAIIIGVLVGLAVFVSLALMRISILVCLKWGFAVGIFVAAVFGGYWTWRSTTYDWRMDERERRRRWGFEDMQMRGGEEIESDVSPDESASARHLDYIARLVLERQYIEGLPTNRDSCVKARICTQPEWNTINQILQAAGIKDKRTWQAESFEAAIQKYRSNVSVDGDIVLVKGLGNSWQRINL